MKLNNEEQKQLKEFISDKYIRVGKHSTLPLSIYNYTPKTQYDEFWNKITRMCRGLVLNDDYEIIIKPPEKFFNQGEQYAPDINLANARISEKLDGYYISIKNDAKYGLLVTSRGSFDNQYTKAAKSLLNRFKIANMPKNYTYFCELLQNFEGDETLILTQHPEPKLVCWGIRDEDFNELIPDKDCILPIAKELSLEEAKEYLKQQVEGVVAQDLKTKDRVKIKTEYFIKNHFIISRCTKKRAWEVLSQGKCLEDLGIPDEFMSHMKEYEKELTAEYQAFWSKILQADYETSELSDKELGLLDDYKELKPFLFLLRKDKYQECFDKIWQKIKPIDMV